MRNLCLLLSFLFIISAASATEKAAAPKADMPNTETKADTKFDNKSEMKCSAGKDERILKINEANGGCKLQYTKAGETKEVASQNMGRTKCDEIFNRIEEKLKAAGFNCQ